MIGIGITQALCGVDFLQQLTRQTIVTKHFWLLPRREKGSGKEKKRYCIWCLLKTFGRAKAMYPDIEFAGAKALHSVMMAVKLYNKWLAQRPILAKSTTSGVLGMAGALVSNKLKVQFWISRLRDIWLMQLFRLKSLIVHFRAFQIRCRQFCHMGRLASFSLVQSCTIFTRILRPFLAQTFRPKSLWKDASIRLCSSCCPYILSKGCK